MPPIEAAALGVPLAVSRIAPHEEALRDLEEGEAHWVNPHDLHAWAEAFKTAQKGRIAAISRESRVRLAERYSVRRLGEHMDRVYRRVLLPGT